MILRWVSAGCLVLTVLVFAPQARAGLADEKALAERYAPVVRAVEQVEECGHGSPYDPIDVDLLFGEPTVALRGPWSPSDLVKIGPSAEDLVDRFEYHLDFPGNALDPGCGYERWNRRLTEGSAPTVYAHITSEAGHPGKLALQYWFFYTFNDFNNTHEGDWEMIQLVFGAVDAQEALAERPVMVGYSSHEGAERASWGDEKLELVDGTHPVVYPASGSNANKFTQALYLGSSAEAGVGCDDTRSPHRESRPTVKTIPSNPAAAEAAFPWLAFEGRWGELQRAFFNGPTGPNLKEQWTRPITWSETWRERGYAVPSGGLLGTGATDVFCTGIAKGSRGLILFLRSPLLVLLAIGALLGLIALVIGRATWRPSAPFRLARRRSWGQILSAAARVYVSHTRIFLGIGLILIPIALAITALQWLAREGIDLFATLTGDAAGAFAVTAVVIGTTFALLGLGLVQAATACALLELDAGRTIGPVHAYRTAMRRARPLLAATAIFVAAWVVLSSTLLIPVAIWLAIRWCLLAPAVEIERCTGASALRLSSRLVRRRWLKVGSLVGLSAAIALLTGPLLGAILILATETPLALLNIVAGVVYALTLPYVAIVTTYVYADAATRHQLDTADEPSHLPAEIELRRSSA